MTETLGLSIAVVVDRALLLLGTIVPGQLQQTFPLRRSATLLNFGVGRRVAQEIKVKLILWVLTGADQSHAHGFLVEFQASFGILHTQHGVVQSVATRVGGGAEILIGATNNLNPVSIGILGEGDVSHTAFRQFFLEGVAGIFNALAGSFNVVNRDSNVTETTVRLCVSVHHTVVGVILSAVIVSQFQNGIAIGPVTVTLERGGAVICQEVVAELPFRHVDRVDQAQTEELVKIHRFLRVFDPDHRIYSVRIVSVIVSKDVGSIGHERLSL